MDNCIFCKIINKEIPGYIIYEDDDVLAFLDAFPTSKGHCLIVPKKHYKNILECDEKTICNMIKVSQTIGKALLKTYGLGLNLVSNINEIAGQSVMHAHLHLIPVNMDGSKVEIIFKSLEEKLNLEEIRKSIKEQM